MYKLSPVGVMYRSGMFLGDNFSPERSIVIYRSNRSAYFGLERIDAFPMLHARHRIGIKEELS
jgi:hypothetical protein